MENEFKIDPARILLIKKYPDPILKMVCEPISEITQEIKTLIQNMFTTMYGRYGVGLSANQVGVSKRVFVMDTSNSGLKRYAFINPRIIEFSNEFDRYKEGCLSFPDVFAFVRRPKEIKISALNEEGEVFELDLQGVDAVCYQHELDHLNGITFYDHLSPVQKNLIKKRMLNLKNQ